jgi:hypothetical protein
MRRQRSGGFPTEVDVHVYETKEGDAIELTGREICDAVKSGEFTAVKALPGPTVDCGCACGDSSQPAESPAPQSEQA